MCLASGRPAKNMSAIAQTLFEHTAGLPMVCFNGALAVVLDSEGKVGRTLHEQRLPASVAEMVLQFSEEVGYPCQWCDVSETFNNATDPEGEALLRSLEVS